MNNRTNIIIILCDDMGFSDIGCYGGEIDTPNIDMLAYNGVRFSQFYNAPRCCPSRASLLTGLYSHQAHIGLMTENIGAEGYLGDLSPHSVTIAEVLKLGGYRTYMSGKWHVTRYYVEGPKHNWPCQRGFDDFYGIIGGGANYYQPRTLTRNNETIFPEEDYYITDNISDEAVKQIKNHKKNYSGQPFFQYVAFTAPHWPLHAYEDDIQKYKGRYDQGWDVLRQKRMRKLKDMGIIDKNWRLTDRDSRLPAWEDVDNKEWQARRMEIYAAQVERMDKGIGKIIQALKECDQWENTLIFFLSDNGGCAEELPEAVKSFVIDGMAATEKTRDGRNVRFGNIPSLMPGGEETYQSYGAGWANMSNTPFRLYKHWVHEGGISTPLVAHWPKGIESKGEIRHQVAQLPDIMATCIDIAGIEYPNDYNGWGIKPIEGYSMTSAFDNEAHGREALYWEHEGNKGVRKGDWKLVCKYPGGWELYNMNRDRTEIDDVSAEYPDIVNELSDIYEKWAKRCDVLPWDEVLARMKAKTPL